MNYPRIIRLVSTSFALTALVACGDSSQKPTAAPTKPVDDHGHAHTDGHDHDHGHDQAKKHEAHSGTVIDLGTVTVGAFNLKATRDQGEIVAGKDAPIDVTVTATEGSTAKVVGVRFWVGLEDGKGSVKAKAEIENPKEPNRWHTHAEIPNPIPSGSQLWVEIESDTGDPAKSSFALKN